MDYLEIGCTPHGEDCAQVGTDNYRERAIRECNALINQMVRLLGEPPPGARFSVAGNRHDFGTYYEVRVHYDEANQQAVDYAFLAEASVPENWDTQALQELAIHRT